jgi:hypothetical protein
MSRVLAVASLVVLSMSISSAQPQQNLLDRARALHKQALLIDGHNDYPWALREHDPARDLDKLDIRKSPALDHDRHRPPQGRRRRRDSSGRSTRRWSFRARRP